MTKHPCSAVILALGPDKPPVPSNLVGHHATDAFDLLQRMTAMLTPWVDEVLLVTDDPVRWIEWEGLMVRPHYEVPTALNGIHAGLFAAGSPHALIASMDQPWLQEGTVELLKQALAPRWDAVLFQPDRAIAPLPAIYAKRCIKSLARQLDQREPDLQSFIEQAHTHIIDQGALRACDPELKSFTKVERPVT